MRMAITFAVSSEFAPWRRQSGFLRIDGPGAPIYKLYNDQDEIYVLITGVGTRSLAGELSRLLTNSVDLCIASGLTGSLKKEHADRKGYGLADTGWPADSSFCCCLYRR